MLFAFWFYIISIVICFIKYTNKFNFEAHNTLAASMDYLV